MSYILVTPDLIFSSQRQASSIQIRALFIAMPAQSSAQSLLQKAEKKVNSSGGWFSSSSAKYEEAGDLYQQAANAFKLEKLFRESGDCFAKEAECREKCNEINDAANAWWFSAKSYKNGYPDRMCPSPFHSMRAHLTFLTHSSCHSCTWPDCDLSHAGWSVSTGSRSRERDCTTLPKGYERHSQSL